MKKTLIIPMVAALSLFLFSCSDDPESTTQGPTTPAVTAISADVETETATKGAAYSKDVSVDLKDNPLTDEAFAALQNGSVDLATYFRQSSVEKNSSRSATTGADDNGLENLSLTLKSTSTKYKIEVTITATTPSSDCTVLITAVIPAEVTENKKPVVSLVTQVKVGEGAGEASAATINFSSGTIPSATEVNGLILKEEENDGDVKYYKFVTTSDGVTLTKYKQKSGENYVTERDTYTYNPATGELTSEYEKDRRSGMNAHLVKIGNNYYIYSMKLSRASGSGLDSTFSMSINATETLTAENESGTEYSIGTLSLTMDFVFTTTSALTFTGASKTYEKYSYSAEYKALMLKELEKNKQYYNTQEQYDEMVAMFTQGTSYTVSSALSGVYKNEDGVLTVKGKTYSTSTEPNGTVESEISEFDNGIALYDGTNLYLGEGYTVSDTMPTIRDYN